MTDFENKLVDECLKIGVSNACIIEVSEIKFDIALRDYCKKNSCGKYNNNWTCPPSIGEPEELIKISKNYKKALIFQNISNLKNSFDLKGMISASKEHSEKASKIAEIVNINFHANCLTLAAGGCSICKKCKKSTNETCSFPDKAISSLEAYCIDVISLSKQCNMKYINGVNTVSYFGACLY